MRHALPVLAVVLMTVCSTAATAADPWHPSLSLDGGGWWPRRVRVEVWNDGTAAVAGTPAAVAIGSGADQAALAGTRAESIRVCDRQGTELLFAVRGPSGDDVVAGPIPAGGTLTIPVTVAAGASAVYFVYYDNPAAWPVPDLLPGRPGVRNGDVELGRGDVPDGWQHDEGDDQHRASWSSEHPQSGKRCLKTVVADGAQPTWIATRQGGVHIVAGAAYRLRAWVKADRVHGQAGWYIHVGNERQPMMLAPVISAGEGTFDWREVHHEFTAPAEANIASLGTVLRGTGTAWFDHVTLECLTPGKLRMAVATPESLELQQIGRSTPWFEAKGGLHYGRRAVVAVRNPELTPRDGRLVAVDLSRLAARLRGRLNRRALVVRDEQQPVTHWIHGEQLLFSADTPARSERSYCVYFAAETAPGPAPDAPTVSLAAGPANLVRNAGFEEGDQMPTAWTHTAVDGGGAGVTITVDDPGRQGLGRRCARLHVPPAAPQGWRGWHQDVPVQPGRTYLLSAWVKCREVGAGGVRVHAHARTADGKLCQQNAFLGVGQPLHGTADWTLLSGHLAMPADAATLQLHLTMDQSGTVWHDDVVLTEVAPASSIRLECRPADRATGIRVWQVPAIVKVFQDDPPPNESEAKGAGVVFGSPANDAGRRQGRSRSALPLGPRVGYIKRSADVPPRWQRDGQSAGMDIRYIGAALDVPYVNSPESRQNCSSPPVGDVRRTTENDSRASSVPEIAAARNEQESLQLAVWSDRDCDPVRVECDLPAGPNGVRLERVAVNVVGYVPIDHPTDYYQSQSPAWQRKVPTGRGQCDGWAGWWPDPLLPQSTFRLSAGRTQPIWLTVTVPKAAPAGDYTGRIRLTAAGRPLAEVPFRVHVWNFTLPDENHVAAIYDARLGPGGALWGQSLDEAYPELIRFMAARRLCPDTIRPGPVFRKERGRLTADFAAFDRVAGVYFDELHCRFAYTSWEFYLFGWGHPPKTIFGEHPYPGEPPYAGADRSRLRPEYKRAYQEMLRMFWEHVKAKGWDRRIILYISDEPFDHEPAIRAQMKALCDMIHEVDRAIPIYCSTWKHVPDWNGYLNVWGIGHDGRVPVATMAGRRAAGDRIWFTTDGQMCTDTPYCAVERLLPHYCFQYGAEAYEFWGVAWHTYDPYRFGWHAYIHQSDAPGRSYWVRYPNGDGFLVYPGAPLGYRGIVSSIRCEQAREGVEDYEYLHLLERLIGAAQAAGRDVAVAERALQAAAGLVSIPNAGGRYSTKILPDPDRVEVVRRQVAAAIDNLSK